MRTCQFMLLNVTFFLPVIIFCFVDLRGKHCIASCGEEAAHSLPWPRSVSWQPGLGLLPMGFPTAQPFLWGPITLGRCSFCLRMHKVCSVSAQHGRFLEAVCWVTSVQWFLPFDGESRGWVPNHRDAASGGLATHLQLGVWQDMQLLWASWPHLPHCFWLWVKHWWHKAEESKNSNAEGAVKGSWFLARFCSLIKPKFS